MLSLRLATRRLTPLFALALLLPCINGAAGEPVKSLLEMRHENVVIQKWDLSCGAAALTTLLHERFDDPVTEKEVATALIDRQEYIANPQLVRLREGFSLLDLKRYVDGRGYTGVGLGQLSLSDLEQQAPILVPIHTRGYNHFVVFRGRLGNRVLLADPAWGNRTLTVEQFDRAWIDFPKIGRVGFAVQDSGGALPAPRTAQPKPSDFVTFN